MKTQVQIFKRFGIFDLKLIYAVFKGAKDGQYSVTIERVLKQRTNEQNGYLWGCVYPLVLSALLDAGWDCFTDTQQVHAFCLDKFTKEKAVNYTTGEVIEFPNSTSRMNTVQMLTYTDNIRSWAREYLNTEIPGPDPYFKEHATQR